ncbi:MULTISPECIES: DUF1467 family protein [Halocynthiibacter]|uniref:DUF1467 family protein n=1 Tax=Halocynthiibacter halioticoli TaxID=2986804 RepID=A0AAE3IWX3_9RHOB|nr:MULTISPECIES: DUF1467 family protein [Halocynthiibacter]MCV6823732.1 DUF1467 family protein [Halocynthiibacter halioticoli]MCW4056733.1 DUF1467 family protein [Halocynthiibacter sp. SDUM655004]MDE0590249.1 DUF1467 family protein [Halocynthiibacter sp. C4]
MAITSALVLYAVVWFMTLFVVLPIRLKSQDEAGDVTPGTPKSAPANPQLKKRALIVTLVAAVIWGILFTIIVTETITVRDFDWLNRMGPDPLSGS